MEFIKRTTAPSTNDANYYGSNNTMVKYGYGLPNCTTYVHGRFAELGADESKLCLGDAKLYYNYNDGFKRSATPKIGSIACYNGGTYGHIAIVEEIYNDGTMLISESDYIQKIVFRSRIVGQKEKVYGYALQGFILCPIEFGEEKQEENASNQYNVGQLVVYSSCYRGKDDMPPNYIDCIQSYGAWQQDYIKEVVDGKNPYKLNNGLYLNDGDIREVK